MKAPILRFVQVAAYWLGIDVLFYWLNRRAKRTLCFHHVLPDEIFVPHVNGFEMRESEFRVCIRELKKWFRFSTDVSDPKTITLTFDDGWRNQYTTAAKVLLEEGNIPAILFVAGCQVDQDDPRRAFAAELLAHWIAFVPRGRYEIAFGGRQYAIDLPDVKSQGRVWREVILPLYEADVAEKGRGVLKALDAAYPMARVLDALSPEYRRQRLTGVTRQELDELKARGWLIGWHTENHYKLKQLSQEDKLLELTPPDYVDTSVMAYPYGSPDAVDRETVETVAHLGYGAAVSFMIDPGENAGRYFLPRMAVPSEKYALHFTLSGCQFFLKYRKLLTTA